jgi:hypothetical protein
MAVGENGRLKSEQSCHAYKGDTRGFCEDAGKPSVINKPLAANLCCFTNPTILPMLKRCLSVRKTANRIGWPFF